MSFYREILPLPLDDEYSVKNGVDTKKSKYSPLFRLIIFLIGLSELRKPKDPVKQAEKIVRAESRRLNRGKLGINLWLD